jgi:hypothetical protein
MNILRVCVIVTVAVVGGSTLLQDAHPAQAQVGQPHMVEAIRLLRGARAELEAAVPNKGGHREIAIERTDEAIEQTAKGIEYARTH